MASLDARTTLDANPELCDQYHDDRLRHIEERYRFDGRSVIEVPIDVPWDEKKPAVWLLQEPIVQVSSETAVLDPGAKKAVEHTFEKVQIGYSVWIPVGIGTCPGCEQPYEKVYYQGITWWEWRRQSDRTIVQPKELSRTPELPEAGK